MNLIDDPAWAQFLNIPDDLSEYKKKELLTLVPNNCSPFSGKWTKDKIESELCSIKKAATLFYEKEMYSLSKIKVGTPIVCHDPSVNDICLVVEWRLQCNYLALDGWMFFAVLHLVSVDIRLKDQPGKLHPHFNGWVTFNSSCYRVLEEPQWLNPGWAAIAVPVFLSFLQDALPREEQ